MNDILIIVFAAVVISLYVYSWWRWFADLRRAKGGFDELSKATLQTMQEAFSETRRLDADILAAMHELQSSPKDDD